MMFDSLHTLGSAELGCHQTNLQTNGFAVLRNAFDGVARRSLLDELDRLQSVRPGSPELQDILGFKQHGVLGAIFGQQPRVELVRHYPNASPDDPYFAIRNSFHTERISSEIYV